MQLKKRQKKEARPAAQIRPLVLSACGVRTSYLRSGYEDRERVVVTFLFPSAPTFQKLHAGDQSILCPCATCPFLSTRTLKWTGDLSIVMRPVIFWVFMLHAVAVDVIGLSPVQL